MCISLDLISPNIIRYMYINKEVILSQPESKLSRRIMDALRAEGHFVFKVHGSEYIMAGLPDLIVCAKGLYIGLEVKMPGKKNTTKPIQLLRQEQIQSAGGVSEIVSSATEALRIVNVAITKGATNGR